MEILKAKLAICVVLLAAAVVVRGDCGNITVIPLGSDSVGSSGKPVCGWKALFVEPSSPSLSDLDLEDSWYATDLDSDHFKPVTMPMGSSLTCPQLAGLADVVSPFPSKSNVYVRREFEVDPAMVSTMVDMVVHYIVDNQIMKTYINGQEFGFAYPHRAKCEGVTRVDSLKIPASYIRPGKNTLAIQAWDDGHMAFLDLSLSFEFCTEGELHPCTASEGGAPSLCRARCSGQANFCRNKESTSCQLPFHADLMGDCLCETASSLSCSGAIADLAPGVCYPSEWKSSEISRLVGCPPRAEPCA